MTEKSTFEEKLAHALTGSPDKLGELMFEHNPAIISNMLLNPNMTADMVIQLIRRKRVNENHLIAISANQKWRKNYNLKLELILHPTTPRNISLKYLQDMFPRDLALISRRVTLHPILREAAVNYLKLRLESMRVGEKIMLARSGPVAFLHTLMQDDDLRILEAALSNYRLMEDDVIQYAISSKQSAEKLDIILHHKKWGNNQQIIRILASHKNLGYASRRRVFEKLNLPHLIDLTESTVFSPEHCRLARFVVKERIRSLNFCDLIQLCSAHSRKLLYYVGIALDDPRVAVAWVKNPLVNEKMMREVLGKLGDPDTRSIVEEAINSCSGKGETENELL